MNTTEEVAVDFVASVIAAAHKRIEEEEVAAAFIDSVIATAKENVAREEQAAPSEFVCSAISAEERRLSGVDEEESVEEENHREEMPRGPRHRSTLTSRLLNQIRTFFQRLFRIKSQ